MILLLSTNRPFYIRYKVEHTLASNRNSSIDLLMLVLRHSTSNQRSTNSYMHLVNNSNIAQISYKTPSNYTNLQKIQHKLCSLETNHFITRVKKNGFFYKPKYKVFANIENFIPQVKIITR
jgi:hypothetical protein